MSKMSSMTKNLSISFILLQCWFCLRPHQWTKNLIVFAAPLFALSINWTSLREASLGFFLFCCLSSSFYLINDIADVESDRHHPVKCKRPIAAGLVPISIALQMAGLLLTVSLVGGWMISPALGQILLAYVLLQTGYNLKWKRIAILELMTIAAGFVLRACAGAIATELKISPWFLLCTGMLALFLAVEKRKAELILALRGKTKPRSVLQNYSLPLLTRIEITVSTGTVMSYALWSAGPVVNGASTSWMMLTVPFVLYGIFRYQLLSELDEINRGNDGKIAADSQTERPDQVLLTDKPIIFTLVGYIVVSLLILYLKHNNIISKNIFLEEIIGVIRLSW
jgi:decaprenyl-phosphate phosphoribosyltransferase